MWEQLLPFLLLVIFVAWGARMKKVCKFKTLEHPFWPYAENPGLALELADSLEFVDKVLGKTDEPQGAPNREAATRFQKLDFVLIVLYALFFISVPFVLESRGLIVIVVVVLTLLIAIFDVIEDVQILRMVRATQGSSAKRFGQTKWFFYFATLAAEGSVFFFIPALSYVRALEGMVLGLGLIAIGLGGMFSSLKGSFDGISSATKISGFGLVALALAPFVLSYHHSWSVTGQYAVLMRVPLLLGLVLFSLPFISFFTGAKTLLRGLFDLTPLSLFVVVITSLTVSGTVCVTASIILKNSCARFHLDGCFDPTISSVKWLGLMMGLSLPVILFSAYFSARQKHRVSRLLLAAVSGTVLVILAATLLLWLGSDSIKSLVPFLATPVLENYLARTGLFAGYVEVPLVGTHDPWADHLFATIAFGASLLLYAIVGVYGWKKLGKKRTVPALCSLLMLILMIGWILSGLTFFFDEWRIPTILIVALVGALTAQSERSDHFYNLQQRIGSAAPPSETIMASKQSRVIVVAANGGGIQAGAWAAQVLYGLYNEFPEQLQTALRMISSVSGGSVGNIFFVNWLANKERARAPHEAAAMSSLDEVAWGLAWPDFLRAICPWLFGGLIGRGRALERAWLLNSIFDLGDDNKIDKALSGWNEMVRQGEIPAVVMNATISETGERLPFATTQLRSRLAAGAMVEATELHTINDEKLDVRVVTAARLSATFPYVTPASRSDGPGPQPHVVDGGYYDNYGMATMVEWLDEALEGAGSTIKSVLVIQIHGAPVASDLRDARHAKDRGWFYQAIAPIATLASVRTAGQVAHNNLELELMQQKWSSAGIPIHTVTFEFSNADAPLSWHLTPLEVEAIRSAWQDPKMEKCKRTVGEFLNGTDNLECGCVNCKTA